MASSVLMGRLVDKRPAKPEPEPEPEPGFVCSPANDVASDNAPGSSTDVPVSGSSGASSEDFDMEIEMASHSPSLSNIPGSSNDISNDDVDMMSARAAPATPPGVEARVHLIRPMGMESESSGSSTPDAALNAGIPLSTALAAGFDVFQIRGHLYAWIHDYEEFVCEDDSGNLIPRTPERPHGFTQPGTPPGPPPTPMTMPSSASMTPPLPPPMTPPALTNERERSRSRRRTNHE